MPRFWIVPWLALNLAMSLGALPGAAIAATPQPAANASAVKPRPAARPAPAAAASAPAAAAKAAPAAEEPKGFRIEPAPAWVQVVAPDASISIPSAPQQILLLDRQTRLGPAGQGMAAPTQRYLHTVRQVNEPAGLADASQLRVDFDPQYQKLVIHQIVLWRGSERIDKLDASRIRLLQRETQLERQMLDGRMTAAIVLDDVRIGDRVEWALSLIGDNPVFNGRFAETDLTMSPGAPVAMFQYRLLAPLDRQVQHRAAAAGMEVSSQVMGPMRETVFRRRAVTQLRPDPLAPRGTWIPELLQLSEFADWADVARWGAGLFAEPAQAGPEVLARAAEIRQKASTPADRLKLALDLVQTEVRYFGTEMGASSHRPAPAEAVMKQRFGDCKDKVSLLIALLRALDIEAAPVLVSNGLRRSVAELLPTPLAFDHVIARVQLDGKPLWLDGTRSLQSGAVTTRQSMGLGFGLLAASGSSALVPLPAPTDSLRIETVDTLRFGKLSEPGTLEARHTFHAEAAEFIRAVLAVQPRAEFERLMIGDYPRVYTGAEPDGPVEVQQDSQRNMLTVIVRLRLPSYWRTGEQPVLVGNVALFNLARALRLPDMSPRTRPLRIDSQGQYKHSVSIEFSEDMYEKPGQRRFDETNNFFEVHVLAETTKRSFRIEGEGRQFSDELSVEDWARYRDALAKVEPNLVSAISAPALDGERTRRLAADLAAEADRMRRNQVKTSTELQRKAHLQLLSRSAMLESQRLTPKLRFESLLARGVAEEHLGLREQARADFDQAAALQPDTLPVLMAQAGNALMRGDASAALNHAGKALALGPNNPAPRYLKAYAHYYLRDYAQARDEFTELLKSRAEVERGYAAIWLYLATRRLGADGVAALKSAWPTGSRPQWPMPVLQLLEGSIELDAALKQAREDAAQAPGRQCELYFYAAQKRLLDGDAAGARKLFEQALALNVTEFNEHGMAQRELLALDNR